MLETKCVGDDDDLFGRFCHQHPLSFNISAGHQHPKDVTNVEILSLTSKNCHQDKVADLIWWYLPFSKSAKNALFVEMGVL